MCFSPGLADTRLGMKDWPGLRGHSCDPWTLLPFESAFTVVTFSPTGPHLSSGFDEDDDGKRRGKGVELLTGEGRKHSLKGQMTNCPVLLSLSPLQSAPPLWWQAGQAGEWLVQLICPLLPDSWGS